VWNLRRNILAQMQGKKQRAFLILRLRSVTMA
jgi:hypothetical protein